MIPGYLQIQAAHPGRCKHCDQPVPHLAIVWWRKGHGLLCDGCYRRLVETRAINQARALDAADRKAREAGV